jgi:hypothetical protein
MISTVRNKSGAEANGADLWVSAWVAAADAMRDGSPAEAGRADFRVVALSVHSSFPLDIDARRALLVRLVESNAHRHRPTVIQLPAGFFETDLTLLDGLRRAVRKELEPFLARAVVVVGADETSTSASRRQEAWAMGLGGAVDLAVVRDETPAARRVFGIGGARAVVFVCGEVGGGKACNYRGETEPAELRDRTLLLVPSHARVPGSVTAAPANPRWAHQSELVRFSSRGMGVLTHHHDGVLTAGRPRHDAQSDWIIFRGGTWLWEKGGTPIRDVQ